MGVREFSVRRRQVDNLRYQSRSSVTYEMMWYGATEVKMEVDIANSVCGNLLNVLCNKEKSTTMGEVSNASAGDGDVVSYLGNRVNDRDIAIT